MAKKNSIPLIDRLLNNIQRIPIAGCWIWIGTLGNHEYGRCYVDGKRQSVHRTIYKLLVGPIPDGMEIDHLCRVRLCINPEHLEAVTGDENKRRTKGHRFGDFCKRGHAMTGDNVMLRGRRKLENAGHVIMRVKWFILGRDMP